MRQTEIFYYLVDQEMIDSYQWYQYALKEFKENKKISLEQIRSFKSHQNFFKSLLNEPEKHAISLVKRCIKNLKESIESSKDTLIIIEKNIAKIENILKNVSFE